jgi:hypothetical protein
MSDLSNLLSGLIGAIIGALAAYGFTMSDLIHLLPLELLFVLTPVMRLDSCASYQIDLAGIVNELVLLS